MKQFYKIWESNTLGNLLQPIKLSKFRENLKKTYMRIQLPLSQRIFAIIATLYFSDVARITERRIVAESPDL